jgi:hypothetical protein
MVWRGNKLRDNQKKNKILNCHKFFIMIALTLSTSSFL